MKKRKLKPGDKILITGCLVGGYCPGCKGSIRTVTRTGRKICFQIGLSNNENECFVTQKGTEYLRI